MKRALLLALGIALFICTISFAEVTHQISYQGILKDSTGAPVDDAIYAIKFRIYDDSTSGNVLWETEGYVPVQTHEGLFQHVLGSTNPVPDSIIRLPNQWVGVSVNLGAELQPRTRLSSVPFALSSQHADTARVSLDKTIDAGELVIGALDTARFSAYQDLASENKIGPAPDQVAAGGHVHMQLFEHTAAAQSIDGTSTIELNGRIDLLHRQVNCPDSGYVLAIGSCEAICGLQNVASFGVSDSSLYFPPDQGKRIKEDGNSLGNDYAYVVSVQRIFPVDAGQNDFYFVAEGSWVHVKKMTLSLIFIPSSFGFIED